MLKLKTRLKDSAMIGYDPSFNVNHFFFEKGNFLKDWKTEDGKYAGNIINAYCSQFGINQRMLVVTLQREQGLIEDLGRPFTNPPQDIRRLNGATGCGMWDDGTVISKVQGFEQQIAGACATYKKWYLIWKAGTRKELVPPDKEKWCEPENAITYSLLMYTPHASVLKLNEDIYDRYFPGYTDKQDKVWPNS
jgi:hypothetical protein